MFKIKTYVFPAILQPDDDTIMASFPDIENCFTCGDDYTDALESAEDALCLMLCEREDKREAIPKPSNPSAISLEPGQVIALVKADTAAYRRIRSSRAVKKTLTIPEWMAYQADQRGIGLSQTLQDALRQKLAADS